MRTTFIWGLVFGLILLTPTLLFLRLCENELYAEIDHGFVLVPNAVVEPTHRPQWQSIKLQDTYNPQKAGLNQ